MLQIPATKNDSQRIRIAKFPVGGNSRGDHCDRRCVAKAVATAFQKSCCERQKPAAKPLIYQRKRQTLNHRPTKHFTH
jgi:hypothetical protein